MSEKQLTAHDTELLSCAGIYVEPQTLSGPALVFPISDGEGGEIRVLWQGGAYESATYTDSRKNQLVFSYLELYDLLFEAACPVHSVLMIGAGGCSYPRYLVAHHPEVSCDALEIDSKITALARSHFFVDEAIRESNNRLQLQIADGVERIKSLSTSDNKRYDAILNDCFSGEVPPAAMMTVEWMSLVAQCLTPGGRYLTNVVSAQVGEDAHQLEALIDAARTVFEQVEVVPLDPKADPTEPDNLMLVCQHA